MSRLDRFVARTQAPLDFLALITLWIVMLPIVTWGTHGAHGWILVLRLVLTVVYAADYTIRIVLAEHHWAYARRHWISGVAAIMPPIRILFSVRLVNKMFRRGNLVFFLSCSLILVLNFAIVVYFFEYDHAGATIKTPGEAIWWAFVTVATVGYGDYVPITVGGRIVGVMVMAMGIITLAVVTAQVASSFMGQRSPYRALAPEGVDEGADERTRIAELEAQVASLRAELARRNH